MLKRTIKRFLQVDGGKTVDHSSAASYDNVYATSDEYKKPFWQSRYYSLWTVIVDRLRRQVNPRVLEVGCGSGQLASFIAEMDCFDSYVGFDISSEAISQATEKNLKKMRFEVGDGLTSHLLSESEHNVLICTEVLEHVNEDIELLSRVQKGMRCICTVPNFHYVSHVRHFENCNEVLTRYGDLFTGFDVWGIPGVHREGVLYFLFEGVKK